MLSFKPKTNKTIEYSYTENMTLDQKHNSVVQNLLEEEKKIPKLVEEYNSLKHRLSAIEMLGGFSIDDINETNELHSKIEDVANQIKDAKRNRKKYYLDNSEYIFQYFEEKKNIHNDGNGSSVELVGVANQPEECNDKMIDFFNLKKEDTKSGEKPVNVNQTPSLNKQENYIYKYMKNMSDLYFDIDKYIHPNHLCLTCGKGEIIPVACDGVVVCNHCGIQQPFITDYEKPSYKEPPKEVCFYAYQRINHFREILAQFQAKETTQIPTDVLENIKFQIKKERINLEDISYQRTKNILKNLGYNKYYEHIAYIKNKLGIHPPVMSQELEKTLCNLFSEIQNPYSKYCPNDRTNFLNYYYTVFKLCELLGQKEYLPLLKQAMIGDRIKRIEQDNIWKKICDEMDWEFIPTE